MGWGWGAQFLRVMPADVLEAVGCAHTPVGFEPDTLTINAHGERPPRLVRKTNWCVIRYVIAPGFCV